MDSFDLLYSNQDTGNSTDFLAHALNRLEGKKEYCNNSSSWRSGCFKILFSIYRCLCNVWSSILIAKQWSCFPSAIYYQLSRRSCATTTMLALLSDILSYTFGGCFSCHLRPSSAKSSKFSRCRGSFHFSRRP